MTAVRCSSDLVAEQAWLNQWQCARRFRDLGNEEAFVRLALEAFRMRSQRAEPLHDLARLYLQKCRGDLSLIYADAGLWLQAPATDRFGIESEVYRTGLKEAFTIAASYSEDRDQQERGRAICNWLTLDKDVPDGVRGLARFNYRWYAQPLRSLVPSVEFVPLSVEAPEGFKPGNCSIARQGSGFVALIRAVNYDLLPNGYFDRHGDSSFRQRTLLVRLDADLQMTSVAEVDPPSDMPPPQHTDSIGFEDPRPILWRDQLWCLACVRQLNPEGRAEMVLARITDGHHGPLLTDWRMLQSGMPVRWEKNWMPHVTAGELRFIYSVDPMRVLCESGRMLREGTSSIAAETFRGGTQAIPFDNGWLAVVHEWEVVQGRRQYFHRFLWFDQNYCLRQLTPRFFFRTIASEFAAGIAWNLKGNGLLISFGTNDHNPALALVDSNELRAVLSEPGEHGRRSDRACDRGRTAWEALRASPRGASVNPPPSRTRLFTAFGTVLYVDCPSRLVRHGPVLSSPANLLFCADSTSGGAHRGWLVQDFGQSCAPIVCSEASCHVLAPEDTPASAASMLELVPLERGLVALTDGTRFLSSIPGGQVSLSAQAVGTWELLIPSESWHASKTTTPAIVGSPNCQLKAKEIASYLIPATTRARANTSSEAKKLLIFGYTKWSHGRVYYDLCKHLYDRGYIVDLLDWQIDHSAYASELLTYYDLFMTALDGVAPLVNEYHVPYERMIGVSHHELDMRILIEQKGLQVFDKFASYGVVSDFLYAASLMRGIKRAPAVASLGINYNDFFTEISPCLATVGYAGSMSNTTFGIEWKRGELAQAAARNAGLAFKVAGSTANQLSFHDMPDFYRSVDAVLTTSISEGAGLPAMEAAAAGRLVIGTPVGHLPLKAYEGGGIIAPIEPENFQTFATAALKFYKANPAEYVRKCQAIQEAARNFDWQFSIGGWIALIEAAHR